MNYEDDKAAYWRNCDAWTFSELQCLLDGRWPESIDVPPSSLSVTLVQTGEQLGTDGVVEVLGGVISPMPGVHSLKRAILDAIATGALTPIAIRSIDAVKLHGSDGEIRFKPADAIAWVASRGCFPDFPFSTEPRKPAMGSSTAEVEHSGPIGDQSRRLRLLRELGGDVKWMGGEWSITGLSELIKREKADARARTSDKTVREDLKKAAQEEREQRRGGAMFHDGRR